ncbi:hypothetical protein QBA54_50755 [Streptomyces sp. B21-108]|uniref:hypothetical protein n=1 Tax=Streptomyces sp. B21-108 TaxID=3039419 RepID=UPI002FEEF90A
MAEGTGGSLGHALINAIAAAAGGTIGVRRSYTAKGWHAQISKLTSSPRGYQAAASVGLSANERTLRNWLAEKVEPTAANQRLIDKAYRVMAGRWPAEIENRRIDIHGLVKIGDDERERGGSSGRAPLTVDGSVGDWRQMREAWAGGDIDEEDFEEAFIEDVLEADLGDSSEPWEFPAPRTRW